MIIFWATGASQPLSDRGVGVPGALVGSAEERQRIVGGDDTVGRNNHRKRLLELAFGIEAQQHGLVVDEPVRTATLA
jgi:hypothetical protein